jgi:hypothetical protein
MKQGVTPIPGKKMAKGRGGLYKNRQETLIMKKCARERRRNGGERIGLHWMDVKRLNNWFDGERGDGSIG